MSCFETDWWTFRKSGSIYEKVFDYDQIVNHLQKQLDKKLKREKYIVNNRKIILDKKKFLEFSKMACEKSIEKTFLPVLTFHSTRNPSKVNSIIKHGYLMPGDIHPSEGYTLKMENGNYYGEGVYSSFNLDTTLNYSNFDKNSNILLIVNLVVLGKIEYICDRNITWVNHPYTLDGVYNSGAQTRYCPLNNIIVSGSTKYIIPVMVVELTRGLNDQKEKIYIRSDNKLIDLVPFDFKSRINSETKLLDKKYVMMYRIFHDIYLVKPPDVNIFNRSFEKYRYFYSAPLCYINLNKNFINSLENFSGCFSFQNSHNLILYDDKVHRYIIKKSENIKSFIDDNLPCISGEQNITSTIDIILEKISRETNNKKFYNVVYLFIDNPKTFNVNVIIKKYENLLKVKKVVIKLIFLNHEINNKNDYYKLKACLQTDYFFEEFSLDKKDNLEEIFDKLVEENQNISNETLEYKIPYPCGIYGEGFLTDLTELPAWDNHSFSEILYKGQYIEALNINGFLYPTNFQEDKLLNYSEINMTIIQLLCRLRISIIKDRSLFHRCEKVINIICDKFITSLHNSLKYEGNFNKECDSKLFKNIKKTREIYYQVSTLISDIRTFGNIKLKGKWFDKLINMKFGKKVSKRVKKNFDVNNLKEIVKYDIEDPDEALLFSEREGLGLQLYRTSASEIEPWLIIINYVSLDTFKVKDLYKVNEFNNEPLKDKSGRTVTDLLSLSFKDDLDKLYLGYTFTRTPYLYLQSQYEALLTTTWVSLIEQVFKKINYKKKYDLEELEKSMKIIFELTETVVQIFNKKKELLRVLEFIKTEENIESYITEAHDIKSVNQILGLLTVNQSKELFVSDNYNRFAFALMSEVIMRSCRSFMRSCNKSSQDMINEIFNLNNKTNLEEYKFNVNNAKKKTTKFYFKKRFSNCSPFAVTSVLGFLERYHKGVSIDKIFQDFVGKKINMKDFLSKHLPEENGIMTQIALYLQGIKYHKAKFRQNIKFENPSEIIHNTLEESKNIIKRKQEIISKLENNRKLKLQKRIEEGLIYLEYHKFPKIFNHKEISELNLKRSNDDQLELSGSGLLKHHCCHPNCPMYLVNMSTDEDRKNGKTRKGLMGHLKYEILNENYVKSFHLVCKSYINLSFDEFLCKVNSYFKNDKRYKKYKFKNELLKNVYNQYNIH